MKKIQQFVFYSPENNKNFPQDFDLKDPLYTNPWKYNLFKGYGIVTQLGIQGAPGVIFYLNDSSNPISIGGTGVYELNLTGIGHISRLRFDEKSLKEYYPKEQADPKRKLIVDIVYEGGN